MTNMTNAYKMAIDNVAAKIRGSDTFNAFEAAKYLGAAFCKSEDDIIVDLIRSTAPTASAPASTPSESAAPVTVSTTKPHQNRARLRDIVNALDKGGTKSVLGVLSDLASIGAVRNVHLDTAGNRTLTEDETVDWYAGQIVDVLESEAYFAVNSLINCLDKFVPEKCP